MPDYYFDIETNSTGAKPDTENDEILTIQFQRLHSESGATLGGLTILKSWESSEEEILRGFYSIFRPSEPFAFIPVGAFLHFEFFMLHNRWKSAGLDVSLKTLLYDHPHVDIKPILVILNKGSFLGASLDRFTRKKETGDKVPKWYREGNYEAIETYIRDEAEAFTSFYQRLKQRIPSLLQDSNLNG